MRQIFKASLPAMLALAVYASDANAGQGAYPATPEALNAEYDKIKYEFGPGKFELSRSRSSLDLSGDLAIARGNQARRYAFLSDGTEYPQTEAVVFSQTSDSIVYLSFYESGYVKDDDWTEIDADTLLQDIMDGTDEANEDRRRNGVSPIHVLGWIQQPKYDSERHMAYWAISLDDGSEGGLVNVVFLQLGRRGYSEFTWVGSKMAYEASDSDSFLDAVIHGHSYDPGFRYADYVTGDRLAAFGIASLVATTAGSKAGRGTIAAIVAVIVVFAKKAWFLVFAAIGGIWVAIKRRLSGGGDY